MKDKTMKTSILMKTLLLAALLAGACGGDDDGVVTPDAHPTADAGPDAAVGPPAKPALGAPIDRMGRPAINTAANKTFTADATRSAAEDAYNHNGDPATWVATFAADMKATVAILDGLDADCGNQLLADANPQMRYSVLAGVLAGDMLQVDASKTSCGAYLAVEANATGVLANNECGGRTFEMDVIETSYSVLAAGALAGVDDGIGFTAHTTATFPYLGAPTT
jgi:hypothetical protein